MKEAKVRQIVFDAIGEINQQLPKDKRVEKSLGAGLFGDTGSIDSLGLINLIVETEQKIENEFGVELTLTDQEMMSHQKSPFQTVGSFVNYILSLLGNKKWILKN